ncbi:GntR family transcriptional regulator [Kosmotoga arenicorallina S304]|uniref:GntR family transcriptional regulator n=1 Tax=Kosmotoga arenicorallina S304 TaxID=1453497 RepID=A0A176K0M7_9BACT|nr:GntR family transcriptional regulator [Kosmotoga arenicorallina S304]
MVLSPTDPDPYYKQIEDQIKKEIISGRLKSGTKLPSVRALAKELNVSVITTKRAYAELEKEGLITTRQGQGTYVAEVDLKNIKVQKTKAIEQEIATLMKRARELSIEPEEIIRLIEEWGGKSK